MGKLDRLETNFVTTIEPFIQDRELMSLKYWHSKITKGVSTNQVYTNWWTNGNNSSKSIAKIDGFKAISANKRPYTICLS